MDNLAAEAERFQSALGWDDPVASGLLSAIIFLVALAVSIGLWAAMSWPCFTNFLCLLVRVVLWCSGALAMIPEAPRAMALCVLGRTLRFPRNIRDLWRCVPHTREAEHRQLCEGYVCCPAEARRMVCPKEMSADFVLVGVGRHLNWRFGDYGAQVSSFRGDPIPEIQLGDQLIAINDVGVAGKYKDEIKQIWKHEFGTSESTALFFKRPAKPRHLRRRKSSEDVWARHLRFISRFGQNDGVAEAA